jgi:serine protease Do
MKQACRKFSAFLFAVAFLVPATLLAQKDDKGDKGDKGEKEKKEVEEIVIVRKGEKAEKVTVEINGDKVTINGKPIEEYKDDNVTIRRHKIKDSWAVADGFRSGQNWNMNSREGVRMTSMDSNRAMLGVSTEKSDEGVEVNEITKESAAEKAGLKKGDIIKKIGDKVIATPDDLSQAIKAQKPGDKVTITYLRDKKEATATAELGKWKGATTFFTPNQNFDFNLENFNLNMDEIMPKIQGLPRTTSPYGQNWNHSGGSPKLGLSVQDTEDGKGVKVIEVDDESNAQKAGLKEEDVITEVDGKAVNSADEVARIIRASKDKVSVMVKLQRKGKTQNIEVKIPRKLKTADL